MRKKGFMTIGYGNMSINEFINRLIENRVNCIVDVRTRPYSQFNVSYNKEELRSRLKQHNISYFWYGNKLGGRYDKIALCNNQGVVDYDKVKNTDKFKEGLKELLELCDMYNVCVMCSEKEPMRCHRFLLISRELKEYNIYHIMPEGNLIKNSDLEKILCEMYGDLNQISLFEEENFETTEEKAYKRQSLKTAYVSEKVKELLSLGVTEDNPEKIKLYCIGCEGKTAEEFYSLLKENKVKRIIDVREVDNRNKVPFANYPDIEYYLRLNYISYENREGLIPVTSSLELKERVSLARYLRKYEENIKQNGSLLSLLVEELDGTCFLGSNEDYKKCYRQVIIKELKKNNKNICVRHLR